MYLDKVEMRLMISQVHTSLVLFFVIVVTDLVRFGGSHGLAPLRSLISYLRMLLVKLGQCMLSHSKPQEEAFHLVKLVETMFHISYGVICVASVLCYHTELNARSHASESMFITYEFGTMWLTQCHRENTLNTPPQIPHLFPLPLQNLAVSFFGYQSTRVRQ